MNDSDPDSDDSYQKELAHVYENQNKNYISLGPGRKEFLIECVKSRAQWTETIFYTNIDLTDFPDRRKDESRSQRKKRGHGAKARQKEARRVRDLISDVPLARQQKPQTLLEKETGLIKPVKPKVRIDCTTSNYFELYENFPVCRMPNNPQEETDFDKKYPHRKHFYYANVAKITKAVRNWINQRESKKESPRLAFYPDGLINLESLELEGMKNFGESKAEDKIILQSRNKLNCCLNFIWPVDISKAGKVRKRRRDDRTYEWMILWCDWDVIAKLPKFMMIVDCVNDYRTEKKELPGGGYYHAIDIFCRKHHVIEALCMSLLYLHCGSVLLKPNVTNHMFLDMISNLERPPRGQRHLVKFESDPFTCFSRELCEFLAVKQGYKSFMTHNEWEKSCVKDVQGRYFWYNSRWRETPFMRMGHESMELFKPRNNFMNQSSKDFFQVFKYGLDEFTKSVYDQKNPEDTSVVPHDLAGKACLAIESREEARLKKLKELKEAAKKPKIPEVPFAIRAQNAPELYLKNFTIISKRIYVEALRQHKEKRTPLDKLGYRHDLFVKQYQAHLDDIYEQKLKENDPENIKMKEIINKYSDTGNKDLKSKSLKWNQYLDPEPENIDAESVAVNFNTESRVTGYEEEKVETTFTPYIREAL